MTGENIKYTSQNRFIDSGSFTKDADSRYKEPWIERLQVAKAGLPNFDPSTKGGSKECRGFEATSKRQESF